MDYFIISLAALVASLLTFFSGFGLGTILTPVFLFFFPVDMAIALTGVVHFLNNIFKLALMGKLAVKSILFRFGIPAILAAFAGATLLVSITDLEPVYRYSLSGSNFEITAVKLVIAVVLFIFSLLELLPATKNLQFGADKLVMGGILSGFFGGLSGHQGALRSAFLIRTGISKEAFIATSVVIACFIDFTRLSIYAGRFAATGLQDNVILLVCAGASAMAGAWFGKRLLKKVTLGFIHHLVTLMLMLIALGLGLGLI